MNLEKLQLLLDKDEIRDLVSKYGQGADDPDRDLFMSCFTDDIEMEFANLGLTARGMAAWLDVMASGKLRPLIVCKTDFSTHSMSNEVIEVDGDSATGLIDCVSHLVGTKDGEPYSALRGLTYHDRYRREAAGWKICYRRHTLKWLMEGVPSPLPV